MDKKFLSNYLYNLSYQILMLIVPIITIPYVSRVLGATALGDYGFTSGIVSYFGILAATGTANYANKEIAFHQSDITARSTIFSEILLFRWACSFVVTIGYIIFIIYAAGSLRTLYIIQLCTVASWLFDVTWLFQGMENFKVIALRNSLVRVFSTVFIFVFVREQSDLPIYTLILSLSMLVGNIAILPYLRNLIVRIPLRLLNIRRHLSGIMIMFSSVVAVQIYTVLDQTMLGVMINTTEVGYYMQAQKTIRIALTFISAYAVILLPRIAVLYNAQDKTEMSKYINLSIDYLFLLSLPLMAGVLLCADDFVPVFFGKGFEPVIPMLRILCVLFIVTGAGQMAGSFLTAVNRQIQCTFAVATGAIVNFILNLILIKVWSGNGACIASVIAETCVTVICIIVISRMSSLKHGLRSFVHYLIPTLVMSGSIVIIQYCLSAGLVRLLVEIFASVIIYFAILLVTKDQVTIDFLKTLREKNG